MVFQSDALDEIQVGIENLLRSMSAQYADKQSDDSLHDESIALGSEHNLTVHIVSLQPHAALASVDKVALGLVFLVEWFLLIA